MRVRVAFPREGQARLDGTLWRRLMILLPGAFIQTLPAGIMMPIVFPSLLDLTVPAYWWGGALAVTALVGWATFRSAGRIAEYNPVQVLALGLAMAGLALGVVALRPPAWVFPLLGIPGGLSYALILPGWGGLVTRILPQAHRVTLWGGLMSFEGLGLIVGPALGGPHLGPVGALPVPLSWEG